MTSTSLPTRNAAWGFYGTIDHLESTAAGDAAKAWGVAFAGITGTRRKRFTSSCPTAS